MRIYANAYELMSEMGRNLWEMGRENHPKTMQNKIVEGNDDFITKELICEQYCLLELPDPDTLFVFNNSRKWADCEFGERINPYPENPGDAYKLMENIWGEFLDSDGKFDYTYSERLNEIPGSNMNPIYEVIELLKKDPDTRKAILPIYSSQDTQYIRSGAKRIPCSMYYDFLIRPNVKGEDQLNICYHQRSSDFVTFFGSDVYLAWCMMEHIAKAVGVKVGNLYHTIDSLHSYKKDWVTLKSGISTLTTR